MPHYDTPFRLLTLALILVASTAMGQEHPVYSPTVITTVRPTQSIKWHSKYNKARKDGTRQAKTVMLFITMDGCIHCNRMESSVFTDTAVAKKISNEFVPARLKLDRSSQLAKDLKVTVFPTTVFIAPNGKILQYVRGYIPTEKLNEHMNAVTETQTASLRKTAK